MTKEPGFLRPMLSGVDISTGDKHMPIPVKCFPSIQKLTVLLILSSLFTPFCLRAQPIPSPDPDFVDAVWVATSDGIRKVAANDATTLFEIADTQDVQAVAVDVQHGVLWAYGEDTLSAYGFNGGLLLNTPVPPAEEDAQGNQNEDGTQSWPWPPPQATGPSGSVSKRLCTILMPKASCSPLFRCQTKWARWL